MSLEKVIKRLSEFEILRAPRATMLLGFPNKEVLNNPDYKAALPQIKELYDKTWRWHGTGRYQYSPPEYSNQRDVVESIIKNDGLIPHRDPLDYSRGLMYSISTSPSRLYSSLYSQLHYEKGKKLRNPLFTANGWALFFGHMFKTAIIKDRKILDPRIQKEKGLTKEGTAYFHNKYSKKVVSKKEMIMGGQSDIPGNYPMLIGIAENAFPEENIAVVLKRHESRSTIPIPVKKFTHIEVPLSYVGEVQEKIKQSGLDILIIPIEWGEEYSKSLPISWIVDGKKK